MLDMEAASIVDGVVDVDGNLILTTHSGVDINAGNVIGPEGPEGPAASQYIAAKPATDGPSTYSRGISQFVGTLALGYPGDYVTVFTFLDSVARAFQVALNKIDNNFWFRSVAMVGDAWTDWSQVATKAYVDGIAATKANQTDLNNSVVAIALARKMQLAQSVLTGGGHRKVTNNSISWDYRFIAMGMSRNADLPNGYFNIDMPPDGTVIPVLGSAETVTVAGGYIPLYPWRALYYEVVPGVVSTSVPGRFKIADYSVGNFDVPSNYVLVAINNSDAGTTSRGMPPYTWGDGLRQDYWKPLTLTNSWVPYGSSWQVPSWRFNHEGKIELTGLMKGGTLGASTPFCTFPASLAPEGTSTTGVLYFQPANTGFVRIDIFGGGNCSVINYVTAAPGTNAFVELDGISWYPAGS
jgi:hypothetical protein